MYSIAGINNHLTIPSQRKYLTKSLKSLIVSVRVDNQASK